MPKILPSPAKGKTNRKQWSEAFAANDNTPLDKKLVARCAKIAYERFLIEAELDKHAAVGTWSQLKEVHRFRWRAITSAVIKAYRIGDQRGSTSSVQCADERPSELRHRSRKAPAQESANRDSGARRRSKRGIK